MLNKKKCNPNNGKALTAEKREAMYQCFFDHGTVNSVVKECHVNVKTAVKYKQVDQWEFRVEETKRKAAEKVDNKNAKRTAENLKLVRNAKAVWAAALMGRINCPHCNQQVSIPKLDPKFADLDKLIRLEEFLSGSSDSRADVETKAKKPTLAELKLLLQQKKERLKMLRSS